MGRKDDIFFSAFVSRIHRCNVSRLRQKRGGPSARDTSFLTMPSTEKTVVSVHHFCTAEIIVTLRRLLPILPLSPCLTTDLSDAPEPRDGSALSLTLAAGFPVRGLWRRPPPLLPPILFLPCWTTKAHPQKGAQHARAKGSTPGMRNMPSERAPPPLYPPTRITHYVSW